MISKNNFKGHISGESRCMMAGKNPPAKPAENDTPGNPWHITFNDEDYVCSLDTKSIRKAEQELEEKPGDRLDAVKALRTWIESQPHMYCRTGKKDLCRK